MKQLSQNHITALTNRLKTILNTKEPVTLKHVNGITEVLIVGEVNNCIYVYNEEPDLIRAFEIEGGLDAFECNVKDAAIWLYYRSFETSITR